MLFPEFFFIVVYTYVVELSRSSVIGKSDAFEKTLRIVERFGTYMIKIIERVAIYL